MMYLYQTQFKISLPNLRCLKTILVSRHNTWQGVLAGGVGLQHHGVTLI